MMTSTDRGDAERTPTYTRSILLSIGRVSFLN